MTVSLVLQHTTALLYTDKTDKREYGCEAQDVSFRVTQTLCAEWQVKRRLNIKKKRQ